MENEVIKNDIFIECLEGLSISGDLSDKLNEAIINRKKRKINQSDVSQSTGKGIATIRRFENGKVDSLFLYSYYIETFTNVN